MRSGYAWIAAVICVFGCGALSASFVWPALAQAPAAQQEAPDVTCRKAIAEIEAALPKVSDVRAKRKAEGELREMKRALEDKQWADCQDAHEEAREAVGA
jgi:hypothetical protein